METKGGVLRIGFSACENEALIFIKLQFSTSISIFVLKYISISKLVKQIKQKWETTKVRDP